MLIFHPKIQWCLVRWNSSDWGNVVDFSNLWFDFYFYFYHSSEWHHQSSSAHDTIARMTSSTNARGNNPKCLWRPRNSTIKRVVHADLSFLCLLFEEISRCAGDTPSCEAIVSKRGAARHTWRFWTEQSRKMNWFPNPRNPRKTQLSSQRLQAN